MHPQSTSKISSGKEPQSTSCLVNNYNYADYVCEAVESAIEQELAFDEIIVVDDGSIDDSVRRLRQRFSSHDNVMIIEKENGGQLSAFHRGVQESRGDLIFFLDADDRYNSRLNWMASTLFSKNRTIDFLSVGYEEFGETLPGNSSPQPSRDYGFTALSTIFDRRWVGNPTSCLSMRSKLVNRVLPYQDEDAWRIRADDVLVYGSSILGAHKYHLGEPLVEYRIHQNNGYAKQKIDTLTKLKHAIEVNRLISYYVEKSGYEIGLLGNLLPREFRTLERPTYSELRRYIHMCSRTGLPLRLRIDSIAIMLHHYLVERFKKKPFTSFVDLEFARPSLPITEKREATSSPACHQASGTEMRRTA
ncbi:Chondroitin synthase [Novipirellula aureliae]|uniref:Chondroitin synthase n=1 Tax=Novipirellula aureliae TaxID=2527966 RepID=A0A5C6E933_9BACT|nr:glycosyltransferase [Novipirellula aureliae]TWU43986.1 Chondroitin synthase [Novipirellula aureliae]